MSYYGQRSRTRTSDERGNLWTSERIGSTDTSGHICARGLHDLSRFWWRDRDVDVLGRSEFSHVAHPGAISWNISVERTGSSSLVPVTFALAIFRIGIRNCRGIRLSLLFQE